MPVGGALETLALDKARLPHQEDGGRNLGRQYETQMEALLRADPIAVIAPPSQPTPNVIHSPGRGKWRGRDLSEQKDRGRMLGEYSQRATKADSPPLEPDARPSRSICLLVPSTQRLCSLSLDPMHTPRSRRPPTSLPQMLTTIQAPGIFRRTSTRASPRPTLGTTA